MAAGASVIAPPVALAHSIGPNYKSEIRSITPKTAGLEVVVLKKIGDIQMINHSGKTVIVYGYDHDPYVKLAADGKVYVNTRSPAKFLNLDEYGDVSVPSSANAKAKPVWQQVASDSTYAWHDHRTHWMSPEPPRNVINLNKKTKIFDWKVPLSVDGRAGAIAGTLWWAGAPKAPSRISIIVYGVCAVVIIGSAIVLYRRGDDWEDGDDEKDRDEKEAW